MNQILVEIVANFASFLEFSSDAEVPIELAANQLEEIALLLGRLEPDQAAEFSRVLREVAATRAGSAEREFLSEFPMHVGLEEPPARSPRDA